MHRADVKTNFEQRQQSKSGGCALKAHLTCMHLCVCNSIISKRRSSNVIVQRFQNDSGVNKQINCDADRSGGSGGHADRQSERSCDSVTRLAVKSTSTVGIWL